MVFIFKHIGEKNSFQFYLDQHTSGGFSKKIKKNVLALVSRPLPNKISPRDF